MANTQLYNSDTLPTGELILFPKENSSYKEFQKARTDGYFLLFEDLIDLLNKYIETLSPIK